MGSSTREDFRAHFFFYNIMDKTYVFSNEPSGGCNGSKLDIMALLPNLCGNKGLDPNLLLALNNGYRNQDMWGGAGIWWIWILLLFGWGRGGFGGWGGYGNGGDGCCNPCNALPWALNSDTGRELLMQAIQGNGDAIRQLASTLNCDVKSIETNLCNIQSLIQNVGNQVGMSGQQVINSIQSVGCTIGNQINQCCCNLQSAIERQGYENRIATIQQTDDIKADAASKYAILTQKLDANNAVLIEKFNELEKRELQNKNQDLRDRVQTLEFAASQQLQTSNLIDQLQPCAKPAYFVPNPNCCYGFPYFGYGYGYGANYGVYGSNCNGNCNSCGCGGCC